MPILHSFSMWGFYCSHSQTLVRLSFLFKYHNLNYKDERGFYCSQTRVRLSFRFSSISHLRKARKISEKKSWKISTAFSASTDFWIVAFQGCYGGRRQDFGASFCIIEGSHTVHDFEQIIQGNIRNWRTKIFFLIEEVEENITAAIELATFGKDNENFQDS
ncbi:uncharacterized protein LOC143884985 isoform X2 [Tasmannia lanceolata]|uniref:uncharacterized protein LOC143884985 isoform X2 n=1 Tax=Tasmannia lanceolata TaxID=3420 RepID=UPI004063440F